MNGNIKPIETIYKNRRYRSRLEARCQILLDDAGCRNYYEPEGYQFRDGTRYLPDFYLPDQDAFLECKGVMHQADVRKIYLLVRESGRHLILVEPDLRFTILERYKKEDGSHGVRLSSNDVWMCKCSSCKKVFFIDGNGSWVCPCCGFYDGDNTFEIICYGDGWDSIDNRTSNPIQKAKWARFEFEDKQLQKPF